MAVFFFRKGDSKIGPSRGLPEGGITQSRRRKKSNFRGRGGGFFYRGVRGRGKIVTSVLIHQSPEGGIERRGGKVRNN